MSTLRNPVTNLLSVMDLTVSASVALPLLGGLLILFRTFTLLYRRIMSTLPDIDCSLVFWIVLPYNSLSDCTESSRYGLYEPEFQLYPATYRTSELIQSVNGSLSKGTR